MAQPRSGVSGPAIEIHVHQSGDGVQLEQVLEAIDGILQIRNAQLLADVSRLLSQQGEHMSQEVDDLQAALAALTATDNQVVAGLQTLEDKYDAGELDKQAIRQVKDGVLAEVEKLRNALAAAPNATPVGDVIPPDIPDTSGDSGSEVPPVDTTPAPPVDETPVVTPPATDPVIDTPAPSEEETPAPADQPTTDTPSSDAPPADETPADSGSLPADALPTPVDQTPADEGTASSGV